jgi:hypothetical protein
MINIKAIVERIKSSYPKIRVEEKVKINEQFTADYVIIQGLTIKAIFIPYKKLTDDPCSSPLSEDYKKLAFFYDENEIQILEVAFNDCKLSDINNESYIFEPFHKKWQPTNRSIYKNCKMTLDKLYHFCKSIDELNSSGNNIETIEHQLRTESLIFNDVSEQPIYNKVIIWKENCQKDSLVSTNSNYAGLFYNSEGDFDLSLEINFVPLDDDHPKQSETNQLEVRFSAKGKWKEYKKFRDRRTYNKSAKDSDLPEIYAGFKDSDGLEYRIKKDYKVSLDNYFYRTSINNLTSLPATQENFDALLAKVLDVVKSKKAEVK